ncbi:MAG: O-antigen ligase family protein [Planctomycetaceae bacterium]|nr:O-antigen ligase family protein [Planctomycetaceae bacterium]
MSSFVPPSGSARERTHAQNLPVVGLLHQLTDASLVASMFVVPYLLGGVRPSAALLLGVLAACAAASWLLAQLLSREPGWKWLGVEPLIALGVALLVLQFTPLPLEWRDRLSPALGRLLPAMDEFGGGPSAWQTLSLTPEATRHSLATFVAYAVLFLVSAQRVRSVQDAQRVLRWAAGAAVAMAVFGLVHFVFSNGKFFWYLSFPNVDASEVVHGSFVNRNHLAQFLALGVGPLLMLAFAEESEAGVRTARNSFGGKRSALGRRGVLLKAGAWLGLAVVLGAIALSLSRGGMIAAGAAIAVSLSAGRRSRWLDERLLIMGLVLGAVVVAVLFMPGTRKLETRVDDVMALDLERIDGDSARRKIWEAVAHGIADFPIAGAGVGSHRYVYPMYFDGIEDGTEYTTAESGFLQIGLETGGTGLTLLLLGIGVVAFRCVRSSRSARDPEHSACLAGILGSLAASCVHALVETHWFMPGCMAVTAPLVGAALGLAGTDFANGGSRMWRLPRLTWAGGLGGLAWCVMIALPVHARAMQDSAHWSAVESLRSGPEEATASVPALRPDELSALSNLSITSPRLHLELAKLHLQAFEARQQSAENPMNMADLRQAAIGAEFESPDECREWLARATAGNIDLLFRAQQHVRRCLETCPCEGRAYLYASDLCFLDGEGVPQQQTLIGQARKFRPYTAQVDFAAGQLEWQSGNVELALEHWKRSYARSRVWQNTIARLLIPHMPAEDFLATFNPDWQTLRDLQHEMGESGHPEYPVMARRFAEATIIRANEVTDGSEELLLREAQNIYRRLDDPGAVADCALLAVRFAPGSYEAHAAAARALQALGRDAEALDQLRWCLQRKSNDAPLAELFREVLDRAGPESGVAQTAFDLPPARQPVFEPDAVAEDSSQPDEPLTGHSVDNGTRLNTLPTDRADITREGSPLP